VGGTRQHEGGNGAGALPARGGTAANARTRWPSRAPRSSRAVSQRTAP